MDTRFLLAIDQGTTGTTALIVALDSGGGCRTVAVARATFTQHFPKPGWVEHVLEDIWASVARATREVLARASLAGEALSAVALTNQRETCCIWDRKTGEALGPAIVWQDRRTAPNVQALQEAGYAPRVRQKTGLVLDAYFSGPKIAWMLDRYPGARARAARGELCAGTLDSWLTYKLSGGRSFVTDVTNASRTLLFDVPSERWDPELLHLMGDISPKLLAEIVSSDARVGKTYGLPFLPDHLSIAGVAGDQNAALFGSGCLEPGQAKCTYGTGAFLLLNTGSSFLSTAEKGLLATPAWRLGAKTTYALEGSVFAAGALVTWLRDGLRLINDAHQIEALARTVVDTEGVVVVPALTGLGGPHWRPEARGLIAGLTRGTTPGHIARAALEGIAWQVHDLLIAIGSFFPSGIDRLRVDGGVSGNNLLLQFQADILQLPIDRPQMQECTALGAAMLGACAMGWASAQSFAARMSSARDRFEPSMPAAEVQSRKVTWDSWVQRA